MVRTRLPIGLLGALLAALLLGPDAWAQQPKIIRAGLPDPISTPLGQSLLEFKRIVEAQTGKSIEVQLFPSSQLGTIVEQIANVKQGSQEMMASTPGMFSRFYPRTDVLEMPFLLTDWDKTERLFSSEVFKRLVADADRQTNIRILGALPAGFRNIMNRRGPIHSLADLKGLKIRLQDSPVHLTTFRTIGASPITLPIADVYPAVQSGVVDGLENSNSIMFASKFYEVAKNLTETRHFFNVFLCYINPAFYNGLTESQKAAIEAAIRAAEKFTWKNAKENEQKALDDLAKAGVKIVSPSPEFRAELRKAVQPVYDEYGKRFEPDLSHLQKVLSGQ